MTQPEDTKTRLLREFEEWADATTAEFQSDGEDERNVSFKELAFFDELKKYFSTALDTVAREAKLEQIEYDRSLWKKDKTRSHQVGYKQGVDEERTRVREMIEEYFKGLMHIPIPQATKISLLEFIFQPEENKE